MSGAPLTLGILGGGQLGRMLSAAAHELGVRSIVLDPSPSCPAAAVASEHVEGAFTDAAAVAGLAARVDVLTVEIEHVDAAALAAVEAAAGAGSAAARSTTAAGAPRAPARARPSAACVALVQDKLAQKQAMAACGVPLGPFRGVDGADDVRAAGEAWGYPLMLKSRRGAYDGRGNAVVARAGDADAACAALRAAAPGGLFVEAWVPFARELAVLVVRGADGAVATYAPVATTQRDSVCTTVVAPAPGLAPAAAARARAVAAAAVDAVLLGGAGVFGVELFETADGRVLLNEVAPRVHNSGHVTIEAAECSQFENHVRAVLGLPLGSTALRVGAAVMLNLLGAGADAAAADAMAAARARALATPGAALHWYGKSDVRAGRKMGHVTLTGARVAELGPRAAYVMGAPLPELGPGAVPGAWAPGGGPGGAPERALPPAAAAAARAPLVGIIMGSDSDLPVMAAAAHALAELGVPAEVTIVSAHRTPDRLVAYARGARARGLRVIIAGAGGAAHLPGMVAALTPLPVIGVPVPLRHLDGLDSVASILQMPKGVPVATVAIGNAANAGLLAARVLGARDERLLDAVEAHARRMEEEVLAKADRLEAVGVQAYLAGAAGKTA